MIDVSATYGSNYPAAGYSSMAAFWMEFILTLGLVSVILGTASGAQNIGIVGAFGVGAVHRPGRAVGQPHLRRVDESRRAPSARTSSAPTSATTGCTSPDPSPVPPVAVLFGFVLRGPGGGEAGSGAAQGALNTEIALPDDA